MSTTCILDNRSDHNLKLRTRPGTGSDWPGDSYKIKADGVKAHDEAIFLELNRDEGITSGETFIMRTACLLRDEDDELLMTLEEKLVGLAIGSDIWAKITSSTGKSTGWISDGSKSLRWEFGGKEYVATLHWEATSGFDDLQYTLATVTD